MRSIWATLLFICLFLTDLTAQQYNFKTWSLEHGLPQSEITSLVQGKKGYLWVGTFGGLAAFDGLTFTTFSEEDGLPSSAITSLFHDNEGRTWAGTYHKGVCYFNGLKFKSFSEKDGLPKGGVNSITQTHDGRIWVATPEGVAYFKDNRFHLLPASSGLPRMPYWTIMADKKGNLWAGSLSKGLFCYNGHNTRHFSHENGLSNDIVYSLFESRNGTIWIGTYGGLTKYDGSKLTPYIPEENNDKNRSMSITEDKKGTLWIGLDGGGLLSFDGKEFKFIRTENGLATNYLHSVLNDREGNLWIGTLGSGLQRLTPSCFSYSSPQEGIQNKTIRSVYRDREDRLWTGTFDEGAGFRKNGKTTWFTQKDGLPSNIVSDICEGPGGTVWLATNGGICSYNGKSFKTYNTQNGLIFNIVNCLLPDSDNNLWIATNEGLSFFNGKKFQNFRIPGDNFDNFIISLFKDREGRLWLGTKSGIFEMYNGQFRKNKSLDAIHLLDIFSIAQDKAGNLWFASYDQGVLKYTPKTGATTMLTKKSGLLTNAVTSLHTDSLNRLWIGTTKGLNRLDLTAYAKNPKTPLQSFTYAEGFRGVEVNAGAIMEDKKGQMWFGTINDLIHYIPENEPKDAFEPLLNIFNIRLNSKHVDWKKKGIQTDPHSGLPINLHLPSDENHLTFEFTGIYLTKPELVKYMVKLEGFDNKWSNPSPTTSAIYSNLPPGDYTFKVKACTGANNCNKAPVAYSFSITPPFWSKDRMIVVSVLTLATVAFGFMRWREQNLKEINNMLEKNVEQRTHLLEKKNQEKEILLKEVHHRVKNNLQIITSLLNLQSRHVADPAALDALREVKDRIKSISMLHQRLYQREELSCIELSEYVQTLCKSLFASYGINEEQVRLQFEIPSLFLDIDTALTLGLIVNELVSNTLKYAFPEHRKGTLLIGLLQKSETDYTLTISDDGTGLPDNFDQKMATSFGLQLVSSLIKKLNGSLKFYSQGGTQIKLQFVILPQ